MRAASSGVVGAFTAMARSVDVASGAAAPSQMGKLMPARDDGFPASGGMSS